MKGLIFTYALTYGGALISLFNPFVGLLVYVCFAIIKPESLWHWSVEPGNFSRIVAIGLLVGWAVHGFGKWRFGNTKLIIGSLVAWWTWSLVCTAGVADMEASLAYLEAMAKIVLPVVVGITLIETRRQLKALAWTIMLSIGYVAYDLNMSYFSGFNRLEFGGFGGMDNNSLTIGIVSGVGLAFFLGLGEKQLWKKAVAFACAALMTHAVLFSFSRGGMVALVLVGVVSLLLVPKRPKHLAFLGLGVIVGLMMVGQEVQQEFMTIFADAEERDYSAQSRIDLSLICLEIMADYPIMGLGPEHFPVYAQVYGLTRGKEAHTLWLQTGAEVGVFGLACLLAFYLITIWRSHRFLRQSKKLEFEDDFIRHVSRMVIASLVGFVVAAQFVTLEGLEIPYYVTLLGAGALKLNGLESESSKPELARSELEPTATTANDEQQPIYAA